jgi:hypothetical protein
VRPRPTPHLNKITAALVNPKASDDDRALLGEIRNRYDEWIAALDAVDADEEERVLHQSALLNEYKFFVEVECIARRGSPWLRRQKGQLKLDSSIIEEFLIHLVHPRTIPGFDRLDELVVGPNHAFMSLSFRADTFADLLDRPTVIVKGKDQDFTLGAEMFYKLSPHSDFSESTTGQFVLAVLAAECKVNLDKTMFQEAAGTAARLKSGMPMARYFLIAEFLDMTPEDPRLTDIDNVFLLRGVRRLAPTAREDAEQVARCHADNPIRGDVIWRIAQEMQLFANMLRFDPAAVLDRGSFV